jgi:hypothetical protein
MVRSDAINELAGALAKAQSQIHGAKKDSENPHFRSKYADLASVVDACREALTKNDLSIVQSPRLSRFDGAWSVELETTLMHKSGQFITDTSGCPLSKPDAQGVGSAVTYLRRYALAAFVGVAPEDDDGEAAAQRPRAVDTATGEVYEDRPKANGAAGVTVTSVTPRPTKKPGTIRFEIGFSDGTKAATINERLGNLAITLRDERAPVTVTTKQTPFGTDLVTLVRATSLSEADEAGFDAPEIDDKDLPF